MGNKRRVIRNIQKPPVAIQDTGLVFNGCKVFLSSGGRGTVRDFGEWIGHLMSRSRQTNMTDYYNVHLAMRERLLSGESLWN